MSEFPPKSEVEAKKERFLVELSDFIVEAGQYTWAADAPKVETPQRPGFKELTYQRDKWEYRDSYAGYYMAPGSSVVYYKGRPIWYMTYGGAGQTEGHFDQAKGTYNFLRRALLQPSPLFPVRGPRKYIEEESVKAYGFDYEGNLLEGSWWEWINENNQQTFSQRGDVSIIIDKDENRKPIYPWDL